LSEGDKKKLMVLGGLLGVFLIISFFTMVLPNMGKKKGGDEPADVSAEGTAPGAPPGGPADAAPGAPAGGTPVAPPAGGPPGGPAGAPPGAPAPGGDAMAAAPGGEGAPAAAAMAGGPSLLPWRPDPFAPHEVKVTASRVSARKRAAEYRFEHLAQIPPVRIMETSPERRSQPQAPSGTKRTAPEKLGARLSGVLMNEAVYAILEKQVGEEVSATGRKGYVVKPGDVIDDMHIVKIGVARDGKQWVPTMEVREPNGERRQIQMKEAPKQQTTAEGGAPGMMPGR